MCKDLCFGDGCVHVGFSDTSSLCSCVRLMNHATALFLNFRLLPSPLGSVVRPRSPSTLRARHRMAGVPRRGHRAMAPVVLLTTGAPREAAAMPSVHQTPMVCVPRETTGSWGGSEWGSGCYCGRVVFTSRCHGRLHDMLWVSQAITLLRASPRAPWLLHVGLILLSHVFVTVCRRQGATALQHKAVGVLWVKVQQDSLISAIQQSTTATLLA
jgi:hypothetical protein